MVNIYKGSMGTMERCMEKKKLNSKYGNNGQNYIKLNNNIMKIKLNNMKITIVNMVFHRTYNKK